MQWRVASGDWEWRIRGSPIFGNTVPLVSADGAPA